MKVFTVIGIVLVLSIIVVIVLVWRHVPTDVAISHKIAGTWITPSGRLWHFTQDGSWSHIQSNGIYSGTWQIKDGELIETITNYLGTKSHLPTGSVLHLKIVRVDGKELVEDIGEGKVILKRQ
jgi:hypothetical protein